MSPCCPTPRSPGWSSSTRRPWPTRWCTVAAASLAEGGPVDAVGIANQRASTIVWDRATGRAGRSRARLAGPAHGRHLPRAPGPGHPGRPQRLGHQGGRPARHGRPGPGPVASAASWPSAPSTPGWRGRCRAARSTSPTPPTPASPACIRADGSGWSPEMLAALRIPEAVLPEIVDSSGVARDRPRSSTGAPVIAGMAGDQQASLIGQGCTRPGQAKATFGTGGMLDQCVGADRPAAGGAGPGRDHPDHRLAAGGTRSPGASRRSCCRPAPASSGCGTTWASSTRPPTRPRWRPGATTPATCGSSPPCSGWAPRCGTSGPGGPSSASPGAADGPSWCGRCSKGWPTGAPTCSRRPRSDSGLPIGSLRVDGGMSANPVFTQALADACGRPGRDRPGARGHHPGRGLPGRHGRRHLGRRGRRGRGVGRRGGGRPGGRRRPSAPAARQRWLEARSRSEATIPELSALDF